MAALAKAQDVQLLCRLVPLFAVRLLYVEWRSRSAALAPDGEAVFALGRRTSDGPGASARLIVEGDRPKITAACWQAIRSFLSTA